MARVKISKVPAGAGAAATATAIAVGASSSTVSVKKLASVTAYENVLAKKKARRLNEAKTAQEKSETDKAALVKILKAKDAGLEAAKAKVEAEVQRAEGEKTKAEENLRRKDDELEEARKAKTEVQTRADEAEARCRGLEATLPAREEEAVARFKESPAFKDAMMASSAFQDAVDEKTATMFEDGYLHLARSILADPSTGLDINKVAMLICRDQYAEEARTLHHLIPFSEYNLEVIAEKDAQACREVWKPTPVVPGNIKALVEAIQDEGEPEDMDAEAGGGEAEKTDAQTDQAILPPPGTITEQWLEEPFNDGQQN